MTALGELVYQFRGRTGEWIETKKWFYDRQADFGFQTRVLCIFPPAAAHADERAAFEEWAQGFGWAATEMTWQVDRYLDEDLQLQWSGWQARAAMRAQGEHGEPK